MAGKADPQIEHITLYAVGDVVAREKDPRSFFAHVASTLKEADITFGNCEVPYSKTYADPLRRNPQLDDGEISSAEPPENVAVLRWAGFDIMSFASNHHLDWGYEAFFDTLELLKQNEIVSVGSGRDIFEARKPVIIERKGIRVGFLAYSSVTHAGYQASATKPGCAPMRVWTHYHQFQPSQPGTPPKILTFANRDDLEAMIEDINKLKLEVDLVVVCFHWGLHHVTALLAMYEKEVAHTAIDCGADLILGGHQHVLKGIEVYKGKPIFYGLANFVNPSYRDPNKKHHLQEFYPGWSDVQPGYPLYGRPPEARKTMIVKTSVSRNGLGRVSYYPCLINKQAQPEPLRQADENFEEHLKYVEEISRSQGLAVKLTPVGDEIVVSGK